MSVSIVVDIKNKVEAEIGEIKGELQTLAKDLKVDVDVDTKGIATAHAEKKALGKDTKSLHHIHLVTHGKAAALKARQISDAIDPNGNASRKFRQDNFNIPEGTGGAMNRMFGDRKKKRGLNLGAKHGPWPLFKGRKKKSAHPMDKLGGIVKKFGVMKGVMRRLIPSFHMWMQLIAVILPMIIVLAVELLGLAVAFGAVVVAGAAMMGLGLIGHGNNMADAFENAKQKLGELKQEMFEVFQPTAKTFAPIADKFWDTLPERTMPFAQSLEGLTVFEGTVNDSLDGLVNWFSELMYMIVALQPQIDQLASRFGGLIGSGLLNFVQWVTEEMYGNQDAMVKIGQVFVYVLGVVYNLSKAFSLFLVALTPLFKMLAGLTDLISGKWLVGLTASLSVILAMVYAAYKLQGALMLLTLMGGSPFRGLQMAIAGITGMLNSATASALGLYRALGLVGKATVVGLILGAGLWAANSVGDQRTQPRGKGGSGGTTNYTFNVNGDMSRATQRGLINRIEDVHGRKQSEFGRRNMA